MIHKQWQVCSLYTTQAVRYPLEYQVNLKKIYFVVVIFYVQCVASHLLNTRNTFGCLWGEVGKQLWVFGETPSTGVLLVQMEACGSHPAMSRKAPCIAHSWRAGHCGKPVQLIHALPSCDLLASILVMHWAVWPGRWPQFLLAFPMSVAPALPVVSILLCHCAPSCVHLESANLLAPQLGVTSGVT